MLLTIATGANLGSAAANLARARELLDARFGPAVAASRVNVTKAWGKTDQPDFHNQVLVYFWGGAAGTGGAARGQRLHEVLTILQGIEQELGRQRLEKWGPRTIDLDLISAGDLRYEDERLSLPHPWWSERDFVGGIIRRELPWLLGPVGLLPYPLHFLRRLRDSLPETVRHLTPDHLCYRVPTEADYRQLRDFLAQSNELLTEAPVGGRPIATFRLREPFRCCGWEIDLLELPAPKAGSPYPRGYEHVEFVTDRPLPEFLDAFLATGVDPASIDTKGMDKPHNADFRWRLPGGMSVKFHEEPLDVVIAREQGGQ